MSEGIKGEWISVQDFVKAKGTYPKDLNELNTYYHYTPKGEDDIIYIKPNDDDKDEIILWLKRSTCAGTRIGIRESGLVVKEKTK